MRTKTAWNGVVLSLVTGVATLAVGAGLAFGRDSGPVKRSGSPVHNTTPTVAPSRSAGKKTTPLGLASADLAAFQSRFEREVWPLLSRTQGGCVSCHGPGNPSQLHFSPEGASANFRLLLSRSFLDSENPSGLLARITTSVAAQRMPPAPAPEWSEAESARLRAFLSDLYTRLHATDTRLDEQFPPELQDAYSGKRLTSSVDNSFLTYYQLKRKILTLFEDQWQRGEQDLFRENLAQFGGADFERRFNESSKASASFLSALDSLSHDVASRAYLASSGPFAGRAENLPSPLSLPGPDARYRAEITRLYRRLLFRAPSENETRQAFRFLRTIYQHQTQPSAGSFGEEATLDFELIARDERGRETRRALRLPVEAGKLGLRQQYVDQSADEGEGKLRLAGEFQFRAGSSDPTTGQRFEISNEGTSGNVSFTALELTGPLPSTATRRIGIDDPSVALEGSWQRRTDGGQNSYEDQDNNKGASRIRVPISVPESGQYAVTVSWRRPAAPAPPMMGRGRRNRFRVNARAVPVAVYSHDRSLLANPELPATPPPGEAHFSIDQTVDTIPSWDLKSAFLFANQPGQGVEVRNEGTRKRVVADAVRFQPAPGAPPTAKEFQLDDPLAEGGWPQFKIPAFRPYNLVGETALTDDNQRKGEMRLLYRPARSTDWLPNALYQVFVGFPGQVDNETQVPVVVHARESTPIVRLSAPLRAAFGATVTLDGSASYNVQHTPLRYTWVQNGGPRIRIADPHAAKIQFTVAPITPQQAAWEGLCRALMGHPDFLFTRPRSLASGSGVKLTTPDRRRLQLVKVAQDLVGRPPTTAEAARLDRGTPLAKLVDEYLASQEFRDFYFHRIRLVLESHGTEQDDEPVRLWCYVAFNNRPFKEILTADYTVDAAMRRQTRPAYHGRTGLLTMKGFIAGKPGLPHFNYAAMVTEKFLGYVYEVPPSIVMMREGITAVATTSPTSACYSCHKVLTPLAYQRLAWNDDGSWREKTESGQPVDDSDRGLVANYPYRGKGMEAFATQAVNKERFLRTMFQTHFVMLFGREMRYQADERALYRRLWDSAHRDNFRLLGLLKTLVTSPEYLNGGTAPVSRPTPKPTGVPRRSVAKK